MRIISSRRKITSEKDRYGGYLLDNAEVRNRYAPAVEEPRRFSTVSVDSVPIETYRAKEVNYASGYETPIPEQDAVKYSVPQYADEIGVRSAEPPKSGRYSQETLMPSIESANKKAETVGDLTPSTVKVKKEKSAGPSKLMIILYTVCVVVIAAIVIGTGVAISNSSIRVSALQQDKNAYLTAIAGQNDELDLYSDDGFMGGKAEDELDMEKIGEYNEMDLIEFGQPNEYKPKTNGFDKFCDWLSGIFGG